MRFVFVGLLFVVVGAPFYLGKVKPNRWSGFRTEKTLSNPDIWYTANKTMGLDLMVAGTLLIVFSLALVLIDHYHALPVLKLSFIAFIVLMTGVVLHCFWTLSRL